MWTLNNRLKQVTTLMERHKDSCSKDPSSQKRDKANCIYVSLRPSMSCFPLPCLHLFFPPAIFLLHNLSTRSAKKQTKGREGGGGVMRSVALICRGWMKDEEDALGVRSHTLFLPLSHAQFFLNSLHLPCLCSSSVTPCYMSMAVFSSL